MSRPDDRRRHIATVVGARPQFIKAATVSRRLRDPRFAGLRESIVHTGQHYDEAMSGAFFAELDIPAPVVNLGVGSGSHAEQTGAMMAGLERAFAELRPDIVLVYGDTNSTLAAALVAAKAGLRLAHVEAGLRSFRRAMAEEVNRVVTDRLSDLLFCPTEAAVRNLAAEGIASGVHRTGDVMLDGFRHALGRAGAPGAPRYGIEAGGYALATIHRAENTDDPERLSALIAALGSVAQTLPVLLPLHPRTRAALAAGGLAIPRGIVVAEPLAYLDTVAATAGARVVATDSGGLQKEAHFAGVPCVTLRDETEWVETLEGGWNRLAPPAAGTAAIAAAIEAAAAKSRQPGPPASFGDGDAAGRILDILARP